uniref:Uncharacterized protein n=1 Tax=Anguilla anguilla TaxID=7936 RepID=A0A0E9XU35_ANGAN
MTSENMKTDNISIKVLYGNFIFNF